MRIGLVSYEYPPQQGLGGVGTYMFRLAGALGKAGHEVHVIAGPSDRPPSRSPTSRSTASPPSYEIRSPTTALCAGSTGRASPAAWAGCTRPSGTGSSGTWPPTTPSSELHAQYPLDLVEVPEHAANGWMAGQIHRWPIVMRMHCPWELFVRINRFPFNPMNRVLSTWNGAPCRYPDALTVPSEAMRARSSARGSMRRRRDDPELHGHPRGPRPAARRWRRPAIVCVGSDRAAEGPGHARAGVRDRSPASIPGPAADRRPRPLARGAPLRRTACRGSVPDPAIRARIDFRAGAAGEGAGLLRESRVAVISSRGFESFSYAAWKPRRGPADDRHRRAHCRK